MEFMLDYDWNRLEFLWNLEERLLNHMGFVIVIIIIMIQETFTLLVPISMSSSLR